MLTVVRPQISILYRNTRELGRLCPRFSEFAITRCFVWEVLQIAAGSCSRIVFFTCIGEFEYQLLRVFFEIGHPGRATSAAVFEHCVLWLHNTPAESASPLPRSGDFCVSFWTLCFVITQHSRRIGFAVTQVRPTLRQIMKSVFGGLTRFVLLSVHALNPGSVVRGSWSARSSLVQRNLYYL